MKTMAKTHDVIIVGSGPVGLFLACELGLRGVDVLVLERDAIRESPWKKAPFGRRGINTPSAEHLYRRGLLDQIFDMKKRSSYLIKKDTPQFGGHFAGLSLDINKLDLSRYKYRLEGPSLFPGPLTLELLEKVLLKRAENLPITILQDHGFQRIVKEDDQSISVEAGGNIFEAKWLVACDGGRSAVRKAAGFEFVGTDAQLTGYSFTADLNPPNQLSAGFHIVDAGMYIVGPGNVLLFDFDGGQFDRTQEITESHLETVLHRVTGKTEIKVKKIHLVTTYTDRSMQATSYRKGRVLLAGDAAHIHSPLGAQGLNLGLGDAMNLGWKLATTIKQGLETNLLDTYEKERHPIAEWVLEWTRAQVSTLQPNKFGSAVQHLIRDLIATTDGNNLFIDRVWGLSQGYKIYDGQHELIGNTAPDFELHDGSRLGPRFVDGKGLFLDFENDARFKDTIIKHNKDIEYIQIDVKDRLGLQALLIRPDGVVAWLQEEDSTRDMEMLQIALEKWFP